MRKLYQISGEIPCIGHYLLMSSKRTAYLVLGVKLPARPGTKHLATLTVEKLLPTSIPEGSVVIPWWWARRVRSRLPR